MTADPTAASRRRFLAACTASGITSGLLPGVLWATLQDANTERITSAILADALKIAGLEFTEGERTLMLDNIRRWRPCARMRVSRADPLARTNAAPSIGVVTRG